METALPRLFLQHRFAKPLAWTTCIVIAAGAVAVFLQWLIFVLAFDANALPPLQVGRIAPDPITAGASARSIANRHLFGNPLAGTAQSGGNLNAPETGLQLSLRGIFAQDSVKDGHAIIARADGTEKSYRVGEEIADGATLSEIHGDRVVLTHGGAFETLRLRKGSDDAGETTAGVAPPPATGSNAQIATTQPGDANAFAVNPVISSGMNLNAALGSSGLTMDALAKQVSVLPVIENGRFSGVRLSIAHDSPLAKKIPILPGDIITAVNGITLDSPDRAQTVAQSLLASQTANIAIKRDGKTQNLSISLK